MIDPTTGALGSAEKPPNPDFGFLFYRTLEPGSYQLTIDAPGYTPLGSLCSSARRDYLDRHG